MSVRFKTFYDRQRVIGPLHTAGPVGLTPDGTRVITCVGERVVLTDIQSGRELCRFAGDTEPISSLAVSPCSKHLFVFSGSLSLRIFTLPISQSLQTNSDAKNVVHPDRVISRAHEAPIHVCKVDPTSTYLASGSADGVVKVWDIHRGYITHVFKGHGGVVSALAFNYPRDPSSITTGDVKMQLITGSVDTKIRIFDLGATVARASGRPKPEAVLEGHVSVPRGLDVSQDGKWLLSAGRDSVVLLWDISPLRASKPASKGKEKPSEPRLVKTIPVLDHVEAAGLLFPEERLAGSSKNATSPGFRFFVAGARGVVTIWDTNNSTPLLTLGNEKPNDKDESRQILDAVYLPTNSTIVSIHADQNILFHALFDASLQRQLIGFNDEIVDAVFLTTPPISLPLNSENGGLDHARRADDRLAVAVNSSLIRIYDASGLDARLLEGHNDIVLCLDCSNDGAVLISGSKDSTARVWAPISVPPSLRALSGSRAAIQIGNDNSSLPLAFAGNLSADSNGWQCVAVCDGHAESVGAVAVARQTKNTLEGNPPVPGDFDNHENGRSLRLKFTFTGSQDRTIKMWDLSGVSAVVKASYPPLASNFDFDPKSQRNGETRDLATPVRCKSLFTLKAHEKDINSLDVSPNDRFLASGSQDKTAKVYEIEYSTSPVRGSFKLIGTCEGHKRGVWCVKFGRHEKVLATASGDKTVKLWSLSDFTCIKTFEGHTNSVLRVDFLSEGQQLVSSGSDGLVKIWDVRTEECVTTMDNHEDKVWALAISRDEKTIVSGSADSVITFWEDSTEKKVMEKERQRAELVSNPLIREQDFLNYLSLRDYRNAILLALAMQQPGRLLSLFKSVRGGLDIEGLNWSKSFTGSSAVDEVIRAMSAEDTITLIKYVRDWNSNAKTSEIAQEILYAIVKLRSAEEIMEMFRPQTALTGTEQSTDTAGGLKEIVDGLIPYTERHLARMERLIQESYVVDFLLEEMDQGMLCGGADLMEVDA
ncbi:WD40 repeat-like protein [Thelephora ganbajun]|uniref:WD40 repeat-like protein n=1 Tax=Thelephora ganbajun TaxID=370292 RepID=A0ACB6ZLT4_THEGA|nr:WD40 repeat-like protein [Thelephora ganbajun]